MVFVRKRVSFALQEHFPLVLTTKGNYWRITIGNRKKGKIPSSRPKGKYVMAA